jgi:hypothetical protein
MCTNTWNRESLRRENTNWAAKSPGLKPRFWRNFSWASRPTLPPQCHGPDSATSFPSKPRPRIAENHPADKFSLMNEESCGADCYSEHTQHESHGPENAFAR